MPPPNVRVLIREIRMLNKRYECRTKLSLPNTNPNVRTNEHGMTPLIRFKWLVGDRPNPWLVGYLLFTDALVN